MHNKSSTLVQLALRSIDAHAATRAMQTPSQCDEVSDSEIHSTFQGSNCFPNANCHWDQEARDDPSRCEARARCRAAAGDEPDQGEGH
jgi:hypothetical protein